MAYIAFSGMKVKGHGQGHKGTVSIDMPIHVLC